MATPSIAAGEGRTRWRRFGLVGGVGLAAVALVGYLAVSGALALSFAFSGIPFTLSATTLSGSNFVQYAYPDSLASSTYAPMINAGAGKLINGSGTISNTAGTYVSDTVTQLGTANISGLSQVICAPTPLGNAIRVTLSGSGTTVASNLVIQAPALTATSANFNNINIGIAVKDAIASQGVSDPYGALSNPALGSSFAQSADSITLNGINQVGVGTEAGSFNISGLKLYAEFVSGCG